MKREFLENLGLDKETVDKIMAENGADIEREKAKATQAKADLADAQKQLADRDKDLEQLKATAGDAEASKKALEELQAKYSTETEQLRSQIAERDYADAITRGIAAKSLKFSSKAAERDFIATVKGKKLELKDGELSGFDDLVKAHREAEPDAFAPDNPPPRIVAPNGQQNYDHTPANIMQARKMGEARAASAKASEDVMKNYL